MVWMHMKSLGKVRGFYLLYKAYSPPPIEFWLEWSKTHACQACWKEEVSLLEEEMMSGL